MSLKLLNTLKKEVLEQYWGLAWRDTLTDDSKKIADEIDAYKEKSRSNNDFSYIDVNNSFLTKPSEKRGSPFNQVRGVNNDGTPKLHKGIDYRVSVGTNVMVINPGIVITADMNADPDGYGALISIKHDDGKETRYGHMSRIDVKSGQRIDTPTIIGKTGGQPKTPGAGNSQGPHLHFEIREGGKATDPSSNDNDNIYYRFLNDSDIDKLNTTPPDEDSDEKYEYKKEEITVVVGGQGYATKEWMKSQWELAGLSTNNVTFINYTDKEKFKDLVNDNAKVIMGFSAGGSLIWKEIINNPNKYNFIGLIDPSTSEDSYSTFVNETRDGEKVKIKDMPSMVYSLSNSENWGGKYEDIKKRMSSMETLGLLTKSSLSHEKIPIKFFEDYKSSSLKRSGSSKSKNKNGSLVENENTLVEISKKYIGTPYKFGGCDLRNGIDCSCFVYKIFEEFGANISEIPRSSYYQHKSAEPILEEDLRPGDLVFIDGYRK
jgi:murein DD-endopeptidase MepM/ murein hydrolase activator NlpD/cell wall-associated NlpC family hydrolase